MKGCVVAAGKDGARAQERGADAGSELSGHRYEGHIYMLDS